jgi:hypothetical protein
MSFQNPITGGQGALIRPAIKSPNFVEGVSGWSIDRNGDAEFNNGTFRGVVTASTFEGTDFAISPAGAFFYSGTPATGNLILSIANASGTDPYGNTYPEGLTVGEPGMPQIELFTSAGAAEAAFPTHASGEDTAATLFAATFAGTTGNSLLQITGPSATARPDLYKIQIGSSSYDGTTSAADLTLTYVDSGGTAHNTVLLTSTGTAVQPPAAADNALSLVSLPGQTGTLLNLYDLNGNLVAYFSASGRLMIQTQNTGVVPLNVNAPSGLSVNLQTLSVNATDMFHIDATGNAVLAGWAAKGKAGTAYTWQDPTALLAAGWALGSSASASYKPLRYRYTSENRVRLYGAITATAATPTNTPIVLPAGYQPSSTLPSSGTLAGGGALVSTTSADALKLVGRVNFMNNGDITLGGFTIANGDNFYFNHEIELGNMS